MSQPQRYGVLCVTGSHTHQENYAAAFAADRRCRLIALTDEANVDRRRRDLNERLAKQLGVPYVADLDKALGDKEVNIVCSCAPPDRRGRIAVRCAQARKHLYLDKSLVPQLREADDLVAAVQKAGVKSHMFSFISQPWAREAKRLLESKRLGTLLAIHADTFFAKGRNGTATLGQRRREEYPPQRHQLIESKREMDNCGIYPITLIRWLTGRRYRSVYCVTGNYFFQEHQKHNVEDFGIIAATLDDGLPVTIGSGRYGWTSHPAGGTNRIVLVGSEQTLVVDANRPRLEVYTDESPWTPPNTHKEDPMGFWSSTMQEVHLRPKTMWTPCGPAAQTDAAYFLDRLAANRDSELNVAEAAHGTEVLLAAYRSAANREIVTLPLAR
jgi:predicted dehydrogenase